MTTDRIYVLRLTRKPLRDDLKQQLRDAGLEVHDWPEQQETQQVVAPNDGRAYGIALRDTNLRLAGHRLIVEEMRAEGTRVVHHDRPRCEADGCDDRVADGPTVSGYAVLCSAHLDEAECVGLNRAGF